MAELLNAPLPWDHLDTGIDKQWLKADLQRALEAATVPDCSFEGCSHCGVCGLDFGHNIVVPPPPIPRFTGQFVPNQTRSQRLRVWLGKQGEMAYLSHLDLMRLFDRAVRRASLPISFSGGFHPGPRIIPANALPLGTTSSGEIVDFELTTPLAPEAFRDRLATQLPPTLPIYQVAEINLAAPAATQLLDQAEYELSIAVSDGLEPSPQDWQAWIDAVLAQSEFWIEHKTKSGKTQSVNLRDRLFTLSLHSTNSNAYSATITYIGSCRNDGTLLRPEHIVRMLEQAAGHELDLLGIHRSRLILSGETH
jgi:radical SAM-linked protein